jgi:hypothetical protein
MLVVKDMYCIAINISAIDDETNDLQVCVPLTIVTNTNIICRHLYISIINSLLTNRNCTIVKNEFVRQPIDIAYLQI